MGPQAPASKIIRLGYTSKSPDPECAGRHQTRQKKVQKEVNKKQKSRKNTVGLSKNPVGKLARASGQTHVKRRKRALEKPREEKVECGGSLESLPKGIGVSTNKPNKCIDA